MSGDIGTPRRGSSPRRLAVMTLFMVVCLSTPALAHSDDLAALRQHIEELYRAGKYSEAAPIAERALMLTHAQQGEDHIDTANRMIWLGAIYRVQGRYPEAEPLLKRSLSIHEKVLDPRTRAPA